MNESPILLFLLATMVGFLLSALYSGLETGLYTLNHVRLTLRASRGDAGAIGLRREIRRPKRILTVLLIGTNASNYLGSWGLAELLHTAGLTGWTLILVETVVFTPLVFVFAETLPKELFRVHTDRWTYRLAPALLITRWAFTISLFLPTIRFLTELGSRLLRLRDEAAVSARQRMSQLLKEGVGTGVLSVSQTTLADRSLAMRDRRLGDVMIPWSSVIALRVDSDVETREALMKRRNFSRFPIIDQNGKVVGVLSWVEASLNRAAPTSELLDEPLTFIPQTGVLDALRTMRKQRRPMAIVTAPRSGRPIGLGTLKDLVEPLTGKLAAW